MLPQRNPPRIWPQGLARSDDDRLAYNRSLMQQAFKTLGLTSRGRGLIEFTPQIRDWIGGTGISHGLLTVFIRHTSSSLLIQENADPDVQSDLERFLSRLVPDGDPIFRHTAEGRDDMPAHVRAVLTQTHLSIPVADGEPMLGTWQGVYLYEHRLQGHRREVVLHLAGESESTQ
jgi:secondary thiamine-phosphate synthase enzyme